ncbi:MAG: hypothetical protein LBO00_05530 [Zoogloeaceae bacterium]|jgi:hypothetical protein|nr:hypothetical protein [Zoogloeaceae bacterium]
MPSFRTRSGRVQARITLTGVPTVTKTFPDLRSAREWAKVTEADLLRGTWKPAATAPATAALEAAASFTLGDALRRYRASVTPTKRGGEVEGYRIQALLRHSLAGMPIREVTARHIAGYRDERLALGLSGGSITRELALLSHVFKVAEREWGVLDGGGIGRIGRGQSLPKRGTPAPECAS